MDRTDGAPGFYEDRLTQDPSKLNELLTATRPEDLEHQDADAAYKLPPVGDYVRHDGQPDPGLLSRSAQSADATTAPLGDGTGASDRTEGGAPVEGAPPAVGEGEQPSSGSGVDPAAVPVEPVAPAQATQPEPVGSEPAAPAAAEHTLYRHGDDTPVDEAVWPVADVVAADGTKLYHFSGDTLGSDQNGVSPEWTVYTGETKPAGS